MIVFNELDIYSKEILKYKNIKDEIYENDNSFKK